MRRALVGAVTLVAALAIASPAFAKGPQGATLSGPGIDQPIVIEGNGEYATGTYFSAFVEATGFWELVFSADFDGNNLGILTEAPTTELGESYTVTWHLGDARVETILYPSAIGGSLAYVEPDIWIPGFETATGGGWFRTTKHLEPMLEKMMSASAVPPPTAPSKTAAATRAPAAAQAPAPIAGATGSVISTALLAGLAVAALGGAIWTMRRTMRRRPRRAVAP